MITAFLLLLLIMIAGYSVLASIEAGIAVSMIFPKLSNRFDASKNVYTPVWEITNVLLVVAIVVISVIFNNGLSDVSKIAFVPVFFAIFGLLFRAISGLYIFYSQNKIGVIPKLMLIISSYLTPLSIGVIGIDLFTGRSVWSSSTGILLFISSLIGISTFGFAFVNRHKLIISSKVKYLLYSLFASWAILLGFLLPHSLLHFDNSLLRYPLTILVASIAVSTVGFFLYSAAKNKVYELYQYVILLGFITPILLGLDLRPYLFNFTITLKQAYGAAAYQSSILVGAIITSPFIITGIYLLIKLLTEENK